MSTTPRAMQPVVRSVSIVSRTCVSPHVVVSEGELPEVGVDYAYLGLEGSQVAILVCKCKRMGCLAATQVPEKGMNVYALAFFTGWLRGLGWKPLLLRSDNERALLAFLRAAAASLEGVEVIDQASPEGDHAANGLAEVGVREVKAQTRVQKSHLEERLKRQLDWSEPLATWLVRHSADCLSRCKYHTTRRCSLRESSGKPQTNSGTMSSSEDAEEFRGCSSGKSLR